MQSSSVPDKAARPWLISDLKWKVAFIEKDQLGGSCINYGCTPTKTMMASARIAHQARRAAEFGIHTGPIKVNLAEVVVVEGFFTLMDNVKLVE